MDGLEVFLQMETVAAITYLKVILTVTSAKEREQCFFPKQIICTKSFKYLLTFFKQFLTVQHVRKKNKSPAVLQNG